jgi:hypothetical protein
LKNKGFFVSTCLSCESWAKGVMSKPTLVPLDATANPVYLTAMAISSLIQTLPSGTAYCISMVLIVMIRGRLMRQVPPAWLTT